nr:MAG TPA: hypothetical protein [Caudoviricetes sp.]
MNRIHSYESYRSSIIHQSFINHCQSSLLIVIVNEND